MSALLRNLIYPAWHWAKRDGVNRTVKELMRSQWLTGVQLHELQQRKLADLLSFAGRHVPYYRTILRELDKPPGPSADADALGRLPPLTKEIIRRERDALVSENLAGNGLRPKSTSGSTGEALHFSMDLRSLAYRKAAEIRSDTWTGWRLGERVVRLWGAAVDRELASSLRGRLHGWVTGNLFLSSFDLSDDSMDRYVGIMREFKPVLLLGYPGPLEQFALHCRKRGAEFPSLRGIASSAETLWPRQREIIEESFGVKVFDRYGCREVGQVAAECPAHDGLHVSADRHIIEIVDDEGRACDPGEEGRVLVTDLDNLGMPFIRYDIGDRATWAEPRPCSCGRGLPRLERIAGRTLEVVRTPEGGRIGGTFWTLLLRSRAGIRQFQVIQEHLGGVTIRFVRDTGFNDALLDYYTRRIQQQCGREFSVNFVETDSIELTGSGKRRLIISRLTHEA
jgi:phenylacetate-CoA ligase